MTVSEFLTKPIYSKFVFEYMQMEEIISRRLIEKTPHDVLQTIEGKITELKNLSSVSPEIPDAAFDLMYTDLYRVWVTYYSQINQPCPIEVGRNLYRIFLKRYSANASKVSISNFDNLYEITDGDERDGNGNVIVTIEKAKQIIEKMQPYHIGKLNIGQV